MVDLRVSPESSTRLQVHWDHPAHSNGQVQFYLVRYRRSRHGDCPSSQGRWSRLRDVDVHRPQTAITDLSPYSRYQVKVWARTSAGRGQVAVAFATTATAGLLARPCTSVCLSVCHTASVCVCLRVYAGVHAGHYVQSDQCLSVCLSV